MRLRRMFFGSVIVIIGFILLLGSAIADEGTAFNPVESMKENFLVNVGKRISIRTESGDTIDGTIAKVGDQNVLISKLSGKEFYDAVIRIDKIESFTFRAR